MKKYILHFITITRHKWYVLQECFKRGLYWQGIVHDLSKYSFTEFFDSARFFQGNGTPICAERVANGYSRAWLNHKAKNKHHWDYWTDYGEGKLIKCPIPDKYIKEMACDMVGASKAYNKGEYKKSDPYNYFMANTRKMLMHRESKKKLKHLLKELI